MYLQSKSQYPNNQLTNSRKLIQLQQNTQKDSFLGTTDLWTSTSLNELNCNQIMNGMTGKEISCFFMDTPMDKKELQDIEELILNNNKCSKCKQEVDHYSQTSSESDGRLICASCFKSNRTVRVIQECNEPSPKHFHISKVQHHNQISTSPVDEA